MDTPVLWALSNSPVSVQFREVILYSDFRKKFFKIIIKISTSTIKYHSIENCTDYKMIYKALRKYSLRSFEKMIMGLDQRPKRGGDHFWRGGDEK